MARAVLALLVCMAVACSALPRMKAPAITQELIDSINNDPTSTWRAGWNNKFETATLEDAASLCGALPYPKDYPQLPIVDRVIPNLPDAFDSRTNWPGCPTIGHIRDQSTCGSCWAFGAVEAMEDRLCIFNHTFTSYMSPLDMLSCCTSCGFGCSGGYPASAWQYMVATGVVTGGDYADTHSCAPYPMPPCDHHVDGKYGPCGPTKPTPPCVKTCQNSYPVQWTQDKHKMRSSFTISSNENAIMTEIYTNGPVEAAFDVYDDFLTYRSGVYSHKTGNYLGGHAVKVLGWGVENGVKYWLVANSWNEDWGDQGLWKHLRGRNECGIETGMVAGLPPQ